MNQEQNAEVWKTALASTDVPVTDWYNTAHEGCDRWAADPERIAIVFRDEGGTRDVWTYRRLSETSKRLANAFTAAGLRPGDRVGALLTKQPEAYVTALAAWRAGLMYVPMFVGLGNLALVHRGRMAKPKAIVVDASQHAAWALAAKELTDPPVVWTTARGGAGPEIDCWTTLESQSATHETVHTKPTDTATLMFTSGTSGPPKGCMLTHGVLLCVQPLLRFCFDLRPDDIVFSGADPGWSYGLYTVGFLILSRGHTIIVSQGAFDPEKWLAIWESEKVTFPGLAPSALRRVVALATARGALPKSIRAATCAGEPLDAPLVRAWAALNDSDLRDAYGQTESGMLLANLAEGMPIVPGALNHVVPGFDVVLLPEEGGDVPLEGPAVGIIAVRRPPYEASSGYWEQPDKWEARWRGDWFLTGDMARRDEDGRFWFIGRQDDLIITSGYNVGPTEVETVILADPEVEDAAVVAASDEARGSVVRAVIVARSGVDQAALTKRLQDKVKVAVGRHAYPRIVDYVAVLPRTESGKIKRNELRLGTPR